MEDNYTNLIWFKKPSVLLENSSLTEFMPTPSMNYIEKLNNNLYKITNIDNSYFININSKIIIKDNNEYYFCHLITNYKSK